MHPLNFSLLQFVGGWILVGEGESKPKFGVAEAISLRFGSEGKGWSPIDDIHISEYNTCRVLLYYTEDYIKKGTPKVFRRCEIVENILRLHVRVTKSLWNITKSQCGHY